LRAGRICRGKDKSGMNIKRNICLVLGHKWDEKYGRRICRRCGIEQWQMIERFEPKIVWKTIRPTELP